MTIQVQLGSAQSNLGYQFYNAAGQLIGSRVTSGIVQSPGAGNYQAEATVPDGAVGVYWNDTVTGAYANEDLREAVKFMDATPETPAVVPSPPSDASLCTVYVYTETITNAKQAGIVVNFALVGTPSKTERVLENSAATMTTDEYGFASITLQRTDNITPSNRVYRVNCKELGLRNVIMALEADTFNIASLIE